MTTYPNLPQDFCHPTPSLHPTSSDSLIMLDTASRDFSTEKDYAASDSDYGSDFFEQGQQRPETPLSAVSQSNGPELSTLESPSQQHREREDPSLISSNNISLIRVLDDAQGGPQLVKLCCGGGCCRIAKPDVFNLESEIRSLAFSHIKLPDNPAFRSLNLGIGALDLDLNLHGVVDLPESIVSFGAGSQAQIESHVSSVNIHPPPFVKPHSPFEVFSAPLYHARDLTKPGAIKRTLHFDIDITNYPDESNVDFKVGGAIGICPKNSADVVDDIFNCLGIPTYIRDEVVVVTTKETRWPTIWGDVKSRTLVSTRRELLTWCSDVQSSPPTKQLLRTLAEYASNDSEKKILTFLVSSEGQPAFCDLRTGPHVTLCQLLHAFPSCQPPLERLFSVLPQLMPRFYSLSNDPQISSSRNVTSGRRFIEIAVTVHNLPDWRGGTRKGVSSGFLESVADKFMSINESNSSAIDTSKQDKLCIPMFRGLMANPLSRDFTSDGPMLLIGAGVGIAPFRGFILNRLKNANCANKIWLIQGIRDAALDQLYDGELAPLEVEKSIKKVVESRKSSTKKIGEARYVQDEVRIQADTVWYVINSIDGRIFVCGSTNGMGVGVEEALIDVACKKGGLSIEQATEFWKCKRENGQYIVETW